MKKCPTCEKTFEDNMRFCQSDGTPLVEVKEDAPPADPYATMVASREEIAASVQQEDASKPESGQKDEQVLEIPEDEGDPMKTAVVSEDEMLDLMDQDKPKSSPQPAEFQTTGEKPPEKPDDFQAPAPELPKFNEPELSPPSFDEPAAKRPDISPNQSGSTPISPPEEKFSFGDAPRGDKSGDQPSAPEKPASKPIPSPFEEEPLPRAAEPEKPRFREESPSVKEPESPFGTPSSPFDQPSSFNEPEPTSPAAVQQTEWAPPPSPSPSFGGPAAGQKPSAAGGEDKTLALVSLILGILSIPCCGFLTGIPAVITGFMAKNKAEADPGQYTGRGMALAGIVTGAIGTLLSVILMILQLLLGFAGSINF